MHSFHQLYYHIVWSTHRRESLIDRVWRPRFLAILNEEVKIRGGWLIRPDAMPDHIHLLVRLPPTLTVAEFIGQVKGATAFRANRELALAPSVKLRWQEGYGAFSLRKDELPKVIRYIDNQERHPATGRLSELMETMGVEDDDWPHESQT